MVRFPLPSVLSVLVLSSTPLILVYSSVYSSSKIFTFPVLTRSSTLEFTGLRTLPPRSIHSPFLVPDISHGDRDSE